MRIALIGGGSIGARHLRTLVELGHQVTVVEPDWVKASALLDMGAQDVLGIEPAWSAYGFKAFVIATPYYLHLHYAEQAIMRGIPVFIEKPVGLTEQLGSWSGLAHLAESRGIPTQVGYQCRFHTAAQAMRVLAPAESGFFATACDMRTWPGKSYGPLLLEASHDLDLALSMGAPPTVTEAIIEPHYVAISLGPHWRVTLEDRADYRREWTVEQRGQSMSVTFESPEALGSLMYYDEMAHFITCVQEGRQTDVPLSDGLRVLEVCAQVEQMAKRAA